MPSLDAYLTIRDAAEFLSVAPNTLRNWGRCGEDSRASQSDEPLPVVQEVRFGEAAQAS